MLVIFDCDGVLVDSEPLSNRAFSEALTDAGMPMTPEECVEMFMGRSWMSCEELIRARFGSVPDGLEEDFRRRTDEAFEAELMAVPGVISALNSIDEETCVASSGPHSKMRLTLGLCGLWDRFEGRIFSAWDVPNGKPAPDLFLHAASSMGFEPGDCVVVEDSPVGVAAARAAGMRALAFAGRTPRERLAEADEVFESMSELPGLVQGIAGGSDSTAGT